MEKEFELYQVVKKYLEKLGYPQNSIIPEYTTPSGKHIDIVVQTDEGILVAVEIKRNFDLGLSPEELGYHPISRQLQKNSEEIEAKHYMLSNGKQHTWMQTGKNGRPEITTEIRYSNFNTNSLSNHQFVKFILAHVFEYVKNFPITGDPLYDNSIILYLKITQEIRGESYSSSIDLRDIIGTIHINQGRNRTNSIELVVEEALQRLKEIRLLDSRNAVLEFIDEYFELYGREWTVPRWLADFMVKLLSLDRISHVVDVFARNGTITSAVYLNDYSNVLSCYTNQQDIFWIKIQQLLSSRREDELRFEPGLLRGELDFFSKQIVDGILLAPPFNLKFDSLRYSNSFISGVRDSNSQYIRASLNSLRENGRIVAVVMDGFLLSSLYSATRSYLKEFNAIEAIISLPSDTFRPSSAVKTSLIVLKKSRFLSNRDTFFASLEEVPKRRILNSKHDKAIDNILSNFENFKANSYTGATKNGFIVRDLDSENFHFSKYWFEIQHGDSGNLDSDFTSIPLKQLATDILRGSAIVKDEDGDIPFISPASVRSLLLKNDELSYTSKQKLPKGSLRTVEEKDVIVNIIGPYRGKAALVTSEVVGYPINRHIIVIKANRNLILPEYLAIALNSKYVQEQFLDRSSGSVIQSLNLKSFEEIFLPVPSIEKQESIFKEYSKLLEEFSSLKSRETKILSDLKVKLEVLGKKGGES